VLFQIFLIFFDWIVDHLISSQVGLGRVLVGSGQFDFFKNQVKLDSDLDRSDRFLGSGRVLSPPTIGDMV
jgi:hypothetical protein